VLYIKSARDLFLVGLGARVVVGAFDVTVEGGDKAFTIGAKAVEWGYSRLSALRDFLVEENSVAVKTPVFTAMPAGSAIPTFFMLRRLGFNRRWFRTVNADPTTVPLKAGSDLEILRNIAYIHAVLRFVVEEVLNPRMRLRMNEKAPMAHAVLARSNYSADAALIMRLVRAEIMEKLPRVVLA
jgi:hypothetical protein